MGKSIKYYFILATSLLLSLQMFGQAPDRKKLENEKKALEKEIQLTAKLLDETKSKKMKSLSQLKLFTKQIILRESLLKKVKKGVLDVSKEIDETVALIDTLETNMGILKEEYGKLSFATYKGLNQKPSLFYIFSAESISQALSRIQYFKEFSKYQKNQLVSIRSTKESLIQKKLELEEKRSEKEELLVEESRENERLRAAKKEKDVVFKKLKKDEKSFKKKLKTKRNRLDELSNKIIELIEIETAKNSTEEDILLPLSRIFSKNRGKLPWPMPSKNGLITNHFGIQTDEDGIKVNYEGIDITTTKNQTVRAVFGGKVVEAQSLPIIGKVVIVQHGNFYSVYSHLGSIEIAKGDEIIKLQRIGVAKTERGSGDTYVHFQIRENTTPLDPEKWLAKKK